MGKYKIIQKFPDGGQPKPKPRKPIIVTNPKDKRLQAYSDSLKLYNKGQQAENKISEYAIKNNLKVLRDIDEGRYVPADGEKIAPIGSTGFLYQGNYKDNKTWSTLNSQGVVDNNGNRIQGKVYSDAVALTKSLDSFNNGRPSIYKKPVQPVVYQKPQKPTYSDSLNAYKIGLQSWLEENPKSNEDSYKKLGDLPSVGDTNKFTINHVGQKVNPVNWKGNVPVYRKPQPIEVLEKIFPAPVAGQSRPAKITSPSQSQMPEQQGQIMYGPDNGAIGYMNNGQFTAIQNTDHLSPKGNKATLDLLNDPEALQKYIKTNPRFKYGGMKKSKKGCKYAVGGQDTPTFEEWLQQTGQQLLTGNEGTLYQQYQDYVKTLEPEDDLRQLTNVANDERVLNSDRTQENKQGSYLHITKDPNQLEFSKGFNLFNAGLDLATLVAGRVNDMKNRREEKYKFEKSRYPQARTNPYENGLNNVPITYAVGGEAGDESELEKGEVFQTQDGSITKVPETDATHEDGGSMQPFVFRVLEDTADKRSDINSKLLKVSPEEAMEITGVKVKRPVTHSKLYEESTKYYTKQVKKIEKDTNNAIDYAKIVKDVYGRNTIDENMKNMEAIPTNGMLFDNIFNHQEEVKSKYNITGIGDKQYGGHVYDVGGGEPLYNVNGKYYTKDALKYATNLSDAEIAKNVKSGLYKVIDSGTVPADQIITSGASAVRQQPVSLGEQKYKSKDGAISTATEHQQAYGWTQEELKQQLENGNLEPVTNDGQSFDANSQQNTGNINRLRAEDKAYGRYNNPNKQGFRIPGTTSVKITSPELENGNVNPPVAGSNKYSSDSTISSPATPSKFNEPLRWYDVAGDIMGLKDNNVRTPVPLEQLERERLRYREQSPLPTIQQGQEDFNTIVGMLPQNQIGFANQANLYGKKYSLNNQTFGQYENINKSGSTAIDNQNAANQFQLDTANLSLRDQQQQRIMQGQTMQQENKLKLFNSLFDTIAQNHALNRNGDLMMQMFPYFDQYGKFNGNKYNVAPVKAGNDNFKRITTKGGAVRYVPA